MKKRTRRRKSLETWLNATTTPIFLLNARRKIVFFNFGCERLTGWTAEEVVGQVCDYVTQPDGTTIESLTSSLCPPPEVSQGQEVRIPVYLISRNGESMARLLNFFPLRDEDEDKITGILGVIDPIQQPKQRTAVSPAQRLHAELAALRISLRQQFGLKSLVGQSEPLLRALAQIQLACESREPVFLRGGVGTGKEHVARVIHYESAARSRCFVPLDCKHLPARELNRTLGRLLAGDPDGEAATTPALQPGTLYLQNVEYLPRDCQRQLIEVWWQGDSGGRSPLRLLSSSTIDLQEAVDRHDFRQDLFYRLTTLSIELPPLRRRVEDLAPLAQHFLENLNRGAEQQIGGFTDEVWEQFHKYNWPGNLDELAAVVAESRANCTNTLIGVGDLPFRFRTGRDAQAVGPRIEPQPMPLEPLLAKVEAEQIQLALQHSRYNKSKAAELLGITRARLYRRMELLGIEDREE